LQFPRSISNVEWRKGQMLRACESNLKKVLWFDSWRQFYICCFSKTK